MESERRSRRWARGGPAFCAVPAAGTGDGITGVPIAHGAMGWLLFGLVVAGLVVATAWLMRRWSQPRPVVVGVPDVAVRSELDPALAEELARIESDVPDREPALR